MILEDSLTFWNSHIYIKVSVVLTTLPLWDTDSHRLTEVKIIMFSFYYHVHYHFIIICLSFPGKLSPFDLKNLTPDVRLHLYLRPTYASRPKNPGSYCLSGHNWLPKVKKWNRKLGIYLRRGGVGRYLLHNRRVEIVFCFNVAEDFVVKNEWYQ